MPAMIYRHFKLLMTGFLLVSYGYGQQADAENCNLCHDLTIFGISLENETLRNFEVSSNSYEHSTHVVIVIPM
jgi:hypothetical protein